jgi:hypothetical protein
VEGSCERGNELSGFHKMLRNSSVPERLEDSQEELIVSSMELVSILTHKHSYTFLFTASVRVTVQYLQICVRTSRVYKYIPSKTMKRYKPVSFTIIHL